MSTFPQVRTTMKEPKVPAIRALAWDNKDGPEGASTPESPGLTRITRLHRGAWL